MKYLLGLVLLVFSFHLSFAQLDLEADEHWRHGNFPYALKNYTRLCSKAPKNHQYHFRAGVCILNIAMDKKEAITYLSKAQELMPDDPETNYYLGKAYHVNLQLDDAIKFYEKFKSFDSGSDKLQNIDREIQMAKNAKELIKHPVDVEFENAGPVINSEYPDYNPFISKDERIIVFTSRRKGRYSSVVEFDGYYASDVYFSTVEGGEFKEVKNPGSKINTNLDEQTVGLSSDGKEVFVYVDHIKEVGDIYFSNWKETSYSAKFGSMEKFGETVNSKEFESSCTISPDGNTLFFARRDKKSGTGKDLYMTRKLPNGEWAVPQRLSDMVNTPFDEDFPNLSVDGSTLYFSSKGHNSMGGYDLFKTSWDPAENTFSKPENLGYPVNTPEDNLTISWTENEDYAYISTWRKNGLGDLDIWRIKFIEKDTRKAVIKSSLKDDAGNPVTDAYIIVTDNDSQEEVGNYTANASNGGFIMILSPGNYQVMIEAPGYQMKVEDIEIKGKSDFQDFMMKDFTLSK